LVSIMVSQLFAKIASAGRKKTIDNIWHCSPQ
jgi:hypothetical protein